MIVALLKHSICYVVCILFIVNCASTTKHTNTVPSENTIREQQSWIKATGKVSDMYTANGCGYVIINIRKKEKDTLILIPSSPITGFEKNNLLIKFSYRILKTHTKKGCGPGIPVQIIELKHQ
jgi:hypothetical protein